LLAVGPREAHAELGHDLERARAAFVRRGRVEPLKFRLLERGDVTPVVLPPWAFDSAVAECTTLLFLAPLPTQFVVHLQPWPDLPTQLASGAGALELTRCGRERVSLLGVAIEMRSPRAVVHTLVGVGPEAPPPLSFTLPERDPGSGAAPGDPGPPPAREPLDERLRRFEQSARGAGATAVETSLLASPGYVRLALAPGCHRLLASGVDGAPPYVLLLAETERDPDKSERVAASESGDVSRELCTVRPKRYLISLETKPVDAERRLAVAHFPLPVGLPERFGPELAGRLLESLGGSAAPQKLGPLVAASLGAQGRTPLPRALLPQTCYVAAATTLHGAVQALSLGARFGTGRAEATSGPAQPGPHLGFCTGRDGHVELDVEARGAGVAWLFALFQTGPARPQAN
jgi:hypothetical protein